MHIVRKCSEMALFSLCLSAGLYEAVSSAGCFIALTDLLVAINCIYFGIVDCSLLVAEHIFFVLHVVWRMLYGIWILCVVFDNCVLWAELVLWHIALKVVAVVLRGLLFIH